jgi:cell division protein FtsW
MKKSFGVVNNKIDIPLLTTVLFLSCFGLLMVYNASSVSAFHDFGNKYFYLEEQAKWLVLGLFSMFVTSVIDYRIYKSLAFPAILASLILLLAVFIPGVGIKAYGAHRWLSLGAINFQPGELSKLTLVIYLSAWFSRGEAKSMAGKFLPFLTLLGLLVVLLMLEPDMGTTVVIITTALTLYFLSGAPIWHFLGIIPAAFLGGIAFILTSPYRVRRLTNFLNPMLDPQGASYHIRQILLALGSGGFFGVGIGKSRQKYEYLPEATTDSIAAVIGEELGLIGIVALIVGLLFVVYRGFKIAKKAPDRFGRFLGLGISVLIGVQVAINLSSMVAIIPLTGVPLPFISYGGSSLIVILSAVGILLNIGKQRTGGKQ